MNFTLGFVFDPDYRRVLLIRKDSPAWQRGKINGVGGKLEPGETPVEGMERETQEETGLHIPAGEWVPVGDMQADGWIVHVFAALYRGNPADIRSEEGEPVAWMAVTPLPEDVISNLTWLIPLCMDRLRHGTPRHCTARY